MCHFENYDITELFCSQDGTFRKCVILKINLTDSAWLILSKNEMIKTGQTILESISCDTLSLQTIPATRKQSLHTSIQVLAHKVEFILD